MKQDNKGMSLVELIIVMAIMAILGSVIGFSVSMVSRKAADKCATELKTTLQSNRISTMGKYQSYVEIYLTGNGVCIRQVTQTTDNVSTQSVTENIVGDSGVTVVYKLNDGTEYTLGAAPLRLEFDRSSGRLKPLDSSMGTAQAGKYCVEIRVSKGGNTRVLTIAYLTGKVTLD